jgi:hypothetical protein
MWEQRELEPLNESFGGTAEQKTDYMGSNRATYRLGRGMRGRVLPANVYHKLRPDERGPYLPVIIEACREGELSYEYRDGATSYGAFTYSFVKDLRARPRSTFVSAVANAATTLARMGYDQRPQILGPKVVLNRQIPNRGGANRRRRRAA